MRVLQITIGIVVHYHFSFSYSLFIVDYNGLSVFDCCTQMEYKCRIEMDEHKLKLDKEYDTAVSSFGLELKGIEQRHEREKDKFRKDTAAEEARLRNRIEASQAQEMKQLTLQQKKEYMKHKQDFRRVR